MNHLSGCYLEYNSLMLLRHSTLNKSDMFPSSAPPPNQNKTLPSFKLPFTTVGRNRLHYTMAYKMTVYLHFKWSFAMLIEQYIC